MMVGWCPVTCAQLGVITTLSCSLNGRRTFLFTVMCNTDGIVIVRPRSRHVVRLMLRH